MRNRTLLNCLAILLITAIGSAAFADKMPKEDVIDVPDPTDKAVLQLFAGNCMHCHRAQASWPGSLLDLHWENAFDEIIGVNTEGSRSLPGPRITPGSPGESILFLMYSRESDNPENAPMPPLGVQLLDEAGIELLRGWVLGLEE